MDEPKLKTTAATIAELAERLLDRENQIKYAYCALGDVKRNIYLDDHIQMLKKKLETTEAERDELKGSYILNSLGG